MIGFTSVSSRPTASFLFIVAGLMYFILLRSGMGRRISGFIDQTTLTAMISGIT